MKTSQEKKIRAQFLYEHRCENPKYDSSLSNLMGFSKYMQSNWIYPRNLRKFKHLNTSIIVIQYINRIKGVNLMIAFVC